MQFDINDVLQIFTKLLIIFLILPVHEYAHAFAAHKMGDDTAAHSGRLTMNPLAHIDILGAICLLLTGFGWAKPVPINPLKFKKQRLGVAVTAAAGPISNLLVSFVALIVYRFFISTQFYLEGIPSLLIQQYSDTPLVASSLEYAVNGMNYMFFILYIIECFITINLGLAIFNLIPIPPLDGSKILSYFTSYKVDVWLQKNAMLVNVIFMILIISPILSYPLNWIANFIMKILWFVTGFIPIIMGV